MDSTSDETRTPLRQQSSTLSTSSIGSNSTFVASPPSPSLRRPGYHRVPSVVEEHGSPSLDEVANAPSNNDTGLGIVNLDEQKRSSVSTVTRVPVGSKSPNSPPTSADPLVSPAFTKPMASPFRDMKSPYKQTDSGSNTAYDLNSPTSYQPFAADSEREGLQQNTPSGLGKDHALFCRSRKPLGTRRNSWLAISILVLSTYSMVFSGIWFFIAVTKPKYSHWIISHHMTQQSAGVLCTAFAKSIELSFVTVFVALVGQILSKRALGERKSISVAEMSMRSWVLQPGTMIAHWESVRYAAVTYLGAAALIAALLATLYTTASDALVAPKLVFSKNEDRLFWGRVKTSFANTYVIEGRCGTPIQEKEDPVYYGQTCIELQHSGEAYHNYMQYLGTWKQIIDNGTSPKDMAQRPSPVAVRHYTKSFFDSCSY